MSNYQVLARKWRPQRFEDVIGQRGVTQTLRNAIAARRIAHSFVFSGPRGVGKTTTARILARGLNCDEGPTAEPCGGCHACIEIAQGRDMDVLEIDAATNTQVDKVREVIIAGLGMSPVRDRYKIFIIDEVHRLSPQSFDALLKSIEEPPPHVVFMMATTELEKVPATIQSRSQVFELKTIGLKQIHDHLRTIAGAEGIDVDDAALMLIARAGDGSMRDAQSALDQVIAFAGGTMTAEDVSTVLGLVRRDLLLETIEAVAREDAAAVFDLAGRAVEAGYDLRLVIRELARLTRDLLVIGMDPSRAADPEIAAESEREQIQALAARFSAEDLMRAFDVLTKAEYDIRGSMQPRYQLEMALLRWIHLRKLVPLSELIQSLDKSSGAPRARSLPLPAPRSTAGESSKSPARGSSTGAASVRAVEARMEAQRAAAQQGTAPSAAAAVPVADGSDLKGTFLAEVQRTKRFFYGTVIAQAERVEFDGDRLVVAFAQQHRAQRQQFEQMRQWLEEVASRLAGRKIGVAASEGVAAPPRSTPDPSPVPSDPGAGDRQAALKKQALADAGVQAMLEVFGTDIKEVEEM